MCSHQWRSYEEVAAYLLNKFAEHFALGRFEEKQILPGLSGTSWEIDAKGVNDADGSIVVVECKRYNRNVTQETIAGLAYRIKDLRATGGIVVTTIGLQAGASLVATHEDIITVILDQNSTTTDYMMRFLNKVCLGLEDRLHLTDALTITVTDRDGNIIENDVGR